MDLVADYYHFNFSTGAKEILRSLSEKQGKKMDTAESAKEIPNFIEFFKVTVPVKHQHHHYDVIINSDYIWFFFHPSRFAS